ncbi:MAG: copper amine oxidase N-terminal domain-containing protein, partial [Clostridia bacterium]
MINGNYVAFNAAAPKIINGRTMVPFRAILESLGATVAYDDATTVIAATLGDTSLKFKANDKNLAVTESGTTTNIAMDVLPYVDAKLGSTYVSARFVAQALGYNVSWDDYNRCVIIIDFAKMLNAYDKNFTILNKLFTSNTDMAKTYRMAMTLNMLIETGADSMGMKFAFDVLSKGNAIDGAVNGTVDLGKDATEFGIPDKFSLKIKMDPETYTIYLNSELFKELVPNWTDKTWISITLDDLTEIYAAIGIQIDFKKLLSNESTMTFDDLFAMFVSSSKLPFDTDSYKDISAMLKTVETLLGDKTFKTE